MDSRRDALAKVDRIALRRFVRTGERERRGSLEVTEPDFARSFDAGERIEAVRSGRVDIGCGTTSWSFARQELGDFSLMTFVDGASLLVAADSGVRRMADSGGKRIAVIRDTTTEKALLAALVGNKVKAEIVRVDTQLEA